MKPSIRKIIKYDYFSSLLFIISLVLTILLIAIILVDTSLLSTIVPIVSVSYILLGLKVYFTRKEVYRLKDSKITGQVHKIDKNNGTFYIVINYEVNTRTLGRRFPILAGPVLRTKLRKLKEVTLLVDMDKPKKVYIESFYY